MTFRAQALCTAVLLAGYGLAKAVSIVLRSVSDAIDAALTLERPTDDDCPDYIPDALLVDPL